MNFERNEAFLNWTRPDGIILSSGLMLSYKLFYTTKGVCAVMTNCGTTMCRVQRRIRSRSSSVLVSQELFPFINYTWLLELTYTNNGSTVETYTISVDFQSGVNLLSVYCAMILCTDLYINCVYHYCTVGASGPMNVTVLNKSYRDLNLTWSAPQCPNGIISHYRVC